MFDLKFHQLVNGAINPVNHIYKNPKLKHIIPNGGSIFDVITSTGSRKIKRKTSKKNITAETNDYFRAFYFVYAIPHIEYFKVIT